MPDIRRIVEQLPKAELHVHLRGAAPIPLITRLLNKRPAAERFRHAPPNYTRRFECQPNTLAFLGDGPWSENEVAALFRYMGAKNRQSGIEGIGAQQHLGNIVFVAVIQFTDELHAGSQTVHHHLKGIMAFIQDLPCRGLDLIFLIRHHTVY